MTPKELEYLALATAETIRDAIAPLKARLEKLEQRPAGLKYVGTWDARDEYQPDEACTHGGSLWICREAHTNIRPGDGRVWQLGAKRGRDAR